MVEEDAMSLIHSDIISAMEKLLAVTEHATWTVWHHDPQYTTDGESPDPSGPYRLFNELNTGEWWRLEQEKIAGSHPSLLVIIINCDETPITMTGRKMFPVYATCGNIPRWFRQKPSGWTLIGFLPVVRPIKAFKDSSQIRAYRRLLKRWCMGMLVKPIIDHAQGLLIQCLSHDGTPCHRWVYPRFPFLIADEPEMMHAAVGGYGSTQSRMPCSNCDIVPKRDGLRKCGAPRDIKGILDYMCPVTQTSTMPNTISKWLSIHREFNWMPFVPGFDPFRCPPDRMHQFDHGVFVMVKDLVVACIKTAYSAGSLELFDRRWSWLARLPGSKIFKRGISSLAFVACFENRIMGMGLPFVLRALEGRVIEAYKTILPKRYLEDLAITYLCFRWLVGHDMFTESKLAHLATLGSLLQSKIDVIYEIIHGGPVSTGIKFHKILHWPEYISAYGSSGNWNTETFEAAHKIIKRWKSALSFQKGASAGVKLMTQMKIRDGHTDGHPVSSETNIQPKKKGWGPGGFKGRLDLAKSRGFDKSTLRRLEILERRAGFGQLAVEDLYEEYKRILPISSHDICMLSSVLNTSESCLNWMATPPSSAPYDLDTFALTLFWTNSNNAVQLWKKTYSMEDEAYVAINRDVLYTRRTRAGAETRHVGRVRWICSLRGSKQLIVVQRMREVCSIYSRRAGRDLSTRLSYICDSNSENEDVIKKHCRNFRLLSSNLVDSYHVLPLCDGAQTTTIDGLIMLQPDFSEDISETEEHSSYFLLQYIIQ
jgi:hypothetical protein